MNTRGMRNNNLLYARVLLFFSLIWSISFLSAMLEKKNDLSLQKKLYSRLQQINNLDEKTKNRIRVFSHSNEHGKEKDGNQFILHNKTLNKEIGSVPYDYYEIADTDEIKKFKENLLNDIHSGVKAQLGENTPRPFNAITIEVLGPIDNNHKKSPDNLQIITENKNQDNKVIKTIEPVFDFTTKSSADFGIGTKTEPDKNVEKQVEFVNSDSVISKKNNLHFFSAAPKKPSNDGFNTHMNTTGESKSLTEKILKNIVDSNYKENEKVSLRKENEYYDRKYQIESIKRFEALGLKRSTESTTYKDPEDGIIKFDEKSLPGYDYYGKCYYPLTKYERLQLAEKERKIEEFKNMSNDEKFWKIIENRFGDKLKEVGEKIQKKLNESLTKIRNKQTSENPINNTTEKTSKKMFPHMTKEKWELFEKLESGSKLSTDEQKVFKQLILERHNFGSIDSNSKTSSNISVINGYTSINSNVKTGTTIGNQSNNNIPNSNDNNFTKKEFGVFNQNNSHCSQLVDRDGKPINFQKAFPLIDLKQQTRDRLNKIINQVTPDKHPSENFIPVALEGNLDPTPETKKPKENESNIVPEEDSKSFTEKAKETVGLVNDTVKSAKTIINTGKDIVNWYNNTNSTSYNPQKPFKQLREDVNNNFKLKGYYLEKDDLAKLNKLLAVNKIKVSPETLQRLQRQCAINALRYPGYLQDDYEKLCTDLPLGESNNDVIKNIDDVFASALKRSKKALTNKIMNNELSKYDAVILLKGFEKAQKLNHNEPLVLNTSSEFNEKYSSSYARELDKLREKNESHQHAITQEIFDEHISDLNQYSSEWKEVNPERMKAYNKTIENKVEYTQQTYSLSSEAQLFLSKNGLHQQNYTLLYGNPLQQQLLKEIIGGIEKMALLSRPPTSEKLGCMMYSTAIETFDGARQANEMGDCIGASKLIDLAVTMADYCGAAVEGFTDGIIDSLTGTCNIIRDPIQALEKVALQLAQIYSTYISPSQSLFYCSTAEEWEECLKEYERIAQNWKNASQEVAKWWRETPTRDKIYKITKGGAKTATDIVTVNACLNVTGALCKTAIIEAEAICIGVGIDAGTAAAQLEVSGKILSEISELEQIIVAPARICLNTIQAASSVDNENIDLIEDLLKKEEKNGLQEDKNKKTEIVVSGGGDPNDPNKNNKNQKKEDFSNNKREKIEKTVKTYDQARNRALEIIGEVDVHTGETYIGRIGVGKGKVVGRKWHGNKVTIRLDWDEKKGPHINVTDYRSGSGTDGISVAIPFEGSLETVESLLNHLQ